MKKFLTLFVFAVMAVASYAQQPGDKVDIMGRIGYCWNGDESFTYEDGVITFNSIQWGGLAAWIGGEDWSGYSKVVYEFADPLPFFVQIQVQTPEGTDNYIQGAGEGSTSVEMSFEDKDVTSVTQIALQASGEATLLINAIYLVVGEKKDPVDLSDYVELISNGDCNTNETANFVSKEWINGEQYWGPSNIVVDPTDANNKCIKVISRDVPEGQTKVDEWDSQFFITTTEKFEVGDKFIFKFRVRADKEANSQTQSHNTPGDYNYYYMIGDIPFTTEWVEFEKKGTISEQQVYGDPANASKEMHTIAFNLAVLQEANNYYFDDISLQILKAKEETYEDYTDLIKNGDCQGEEVSNYYVHEYRNGEYFEGNARLVTDPKDSSNKCAIVTSRDIPEGQETIDDWDSQFFITVAEKLEPGDEYAVFFKVRADKAATAQTQAHNQPGNYNYYEMLGNIAITEDWVEVKKTGTITENQVYRPQNDQNYDPNNEMHTIAFNLAVLKEANNYYFDDIRLLVKKAEKPALIGDVNGDGDVNITDISLTVEYVLTDAADPFIFENADTNGDGDINVTDISAIVDIVLGKTTE